MLLCQTLLIFVAGNSPLLQSKLRYSWPYEVSLAREASGNSSLFFVVFAKALKYNIRDSSTLRPIKSANAFKSPKCAFSRQSKYFALSLVLIITGGKPFLIRMRLHISLAVLPLP